MDRGGAGDRKKPDGLTPKKKVSVSISKEGRIPIFPVSVGILSVKAENIMIV